VAFHFSFISFVMLLLELDVVAGKVNVDRRPLLPNADF
jgi:hypothetical protein